MHIFSHVTVAMVFAQDEAEHVAVCFCEGLGSLSGECQDVVETYFPRLWHELMLGAMVSARVRAEEGEGLKCFLLLWERRLYLPWR